MRCVVWREWQVALPISTAVQCSLHIGRQRHRAGCAKIAEALAETAVKMGSTDDVTVVVMRLGA